ncbi:MAG: hypothetical protein ACO1QS_16125 [Verrucomicrobiota bacterium]
MAMSMRSLFILPVIIFALCVAGCQLQAADSPEQNREKVLELVQLFAWSHNDSAKQDQYRQELKNMRTNAIPYLVEVIGYRESKLEKWYAASYHKMPPAIQKRMDQPEAVETLGNAAINLLNTMPDQKTAVPYLVKLLSDDRPRVRYKALLPLQYLIEGSETDLLPVFMDIMKDPKDMAYGPAAYIVAKFSKDHERARKLVEEMLSDPKESTRLRGAELLWKADANHVAGRNMVEQSLISTNIGIQLSAARTYLGMTKDTNKVVAIYTQLLTSSNQRHQEGALESLKILGKAAEPAVPEIVKLALGSNPALSTKARMALDIIAPEKLREVMKQKKR